MAGNTHRSSMSSAPELAALDESRLRSLLDELAREANTHRFRVAPNPCVGAALLAGRKVVAKGFHERWGGPHAEIQAMAAARAAGEKFDTLVCTLEPCSTHGKTPPCTGALLEAGVRRVVVGALDPNPGHRGKGLELLSQMGVEVELISGGSPLEVVAPHFLRWAAVERQRRPRPWVLAKWAQTRTGQLSPPKDVGDGRWISGSESRAEVAEGDGGVAVAEVRFVAYDPVVGLEQDAVAEPYEIGRIGRIAARADVGHEVSSGRGAVGAPQLAA